MPSADMLSCLKVLHRMSVENNDNTWDHTRAVISVRWMATVNMVLVASCRTSAVPIITSKISLRRSLQLHFNMTALRSASVKSLHDIVQAVHRQLYHVFEKDQRRFALCFRRYLPAFAMI